MKIIKRLLLILGILVGVVVLVFVIVLLPPVQKALVLKFAQQPGTKIDAERIAAGFGGVDVGTLRYEMPGVVVTLDSAKVDASLLGLAFGDRIEVDNLEARGLVVDLTAPAGPAAPSAVSTEPLAPHGFFALAALPRALLIDKLALDGKIIIPDATAAGGSRTADFTVASGGIAPDSDSSIECRITLPAAPDAFSGEGTIIVKLRQTADGQLTVATVTANINAQVPGQLPVALTAIADLHADAGKETWTVRVVPEGAREAVIDAQGAFDPQTQLFNGTAKLAVAAPIIAPWLPPDLPAFAAEGAATFSFNLTTPDWDVRGAFQGSASGLAKIDPRLAAFEPVRVDSELVTRSTGGAIRAESYATTVSARGDQPLFEARLLRPLALGADGLPERASLEAGPIAQVALRGIPLSLAQPFLPDGFQLSGGAVSGEFAVSAQGDALLLETVKPLAIPALQAALPDRPLVAGSDVAAQVRARLDRAANRVTVDTLQLALTPAAGTKTPTPTLTIALAQPLAFDLAAGAIAWPKSETRLATVNLGGIPLALAAPFLPEGFELSGGALTGELAFATIGEVLIVDTLRPIAIPNLHAALNGKPLVDGQDLAVRTRTHLDLAANRATCATLRVELATAGSATPALQFDLAQPVVFDLTAGAPVLPQNDNPLAQVTLDGYELPDVSGFVPDLVLNPLPRISGVLTVKSMRDGWAIATQKPLALSPTSLAFFGAPVLDKTNINAAFDARLAGDALTLSRGALELLAESGRALRAEYSAEANLGTLAVPRFSLHASGDLAPLVGQPALRGRTSITGGTYALSADGAATPAITAKGRFVMDNVTAPALGAQKAKLASDFDFTSSADFLTFAGTESLEWTVADRASAVMTTSSTSQKDGRVTFEAKARGDYVNLDDLLAFLAAGSTPVAPVPTAGAGAPAPAPVPTTATSPSGPSGRATTRPASATRAAPAPAAVPDVAPFWAMYRGTIAAEVKRAVYQGNELTDIAADITVAPEAITIKHAGFKLSGNPVEAHGKVEFSATQKENPYSVQGSARGENIDTGALLKMIAPTEPPIVATTANFDAVVSGTAPSLDRLADGMNTSVKLVGNKGETRLFAATSELTTTVGKLTRSGLPALIGLFGGRKKGSEEGAEAGGRNDVLTYVQLTGQVIEFFGSTPFDRFELEATSQGLSRFSINKLGFASELIDIAGKGTAQIPPGSGLQKIPFQLQLDRFGVSGEIGRALGKLAEVVPPKEGETFFYLAKPVPLSGDLYKPDSSQLWASLLLNASGLLGLRFR